MSRLSRSHQEKLAAITASADACSKVTVFGSRRSNLTSLAFLLDIGTDGS